MKRAAVLVPLWGERGVLLTRRAAHLSAHPGQVSFPGGRIDITDASPEAAALREAQEEIGLDPAEVELLGRLPERITATGYHVVPVIGRFRDDVALTPAPGEVAAIFALPYAVLRDPDAPMRRRVAMHPPEVAKGLIEDPDGDQWREFWVWPHEDEYIWGATASILIDLAQWLR